MNAFAVCAMAPAWNQKGKAAAAAATQRYTSYSRLDSNDCAAEIYIILPDMNMCETIKLPFVKKLKYLKNTRE